MPAYVELVIFAGIRDRRFDVDKSLVVHEVHTLSSLIAFHYHIIHLNYPKWSAGKGKLYYQDYGKNTPCWLYTFSISGHSKKQRRV
jgi:hypothetical protein